MQEVNIRAEEKGDLETVEDIIRSAFKDHPFSNHREHLLVAELRRNNALSVSLVAEVNGKTVGHIAFSPVKIDGRFVSWYGLAPLSVVPEYQGIGIGTKLIINGLECIKNSAAKGCVLLGEPEYYARFGFKKNFDLTLPDVPADYFLVLPFNDETPSGIIEYDDAFHTNG